MAFTEPTRAMRIISLGYSIKAAPYKPNGTRVLKTQSIVAQRFESALTSHLTMLNCIIGDLCWRVRKIAKCGPAVACFDIGTIFLKGRRETVWPRMKMTLCLLSTERVVRPKYQPPAGVHSFR
jgi:hypothetical protein